MKSPGFEGDPKIFIGADGAYLEYRDGQPVMDEGLENHDVIALLTTPGWVGNDLFDEARQVGSDFEAIARGPITLSSLNDTAKAAERALAADIAETSEVEVAVANPTGSRLDVRIVRRPPGGDLQAFLLTRNGAAWINQVNNPASER